MALLERVLFLSRLGLGENLPLVIGTHLVVPVLLIAWQLIFGSKSKFDWCLKTLAVSGYILFFYLAGRWSAISVYFRYLTMVLFLMAIGVSFFRVKDEVFWETKNWIEWLATAGVGSASLVMLFLIGIAISGRIHPGEPIELFFPLRAGAYYVINGGSSTIINNYRANDYFNRKRIATAVQYAVDVEKLNRLGRASQRFQPRDYKSYPIFGETVYSPCNGQVVEVVEDLPDLNPPLKDWLNITGNRVVIRSFERTLVALYHLQKGSITVKPGDWVKPGQAIASVGNSGLSIRPHLTIQATQGSLWSQGVPIIFDGQFPVRNRIIIKH